MDLELIGKVRFKKLDGRNTGHGIFKYYVRVFSGYDYLNTRFTPPGISRLNYSVTKTMDYLILRKWAWDTWGESCEFREYMNMWHAKENNMLNNLMNSADSKRLIEFPLNEHWCFENDNNKESRIYLRGDKEKMWFEMRWL